jgi:signal transduction histidine kinase
MNGRWVAASFALLVLVAVADYVTGYELWFHLFYLIPVSVVTWMRGWRGGALMSVLSVVGSFYGDLASGLQFSSGLVPWWNLLILLGFYLAMVVALERLRRALRDLEWRVKARTADLRREMDERERLEGALIEAIEREQRRIGHDLHDSLCQHLTGSALAGQVLSERLEVKDGESAAAAAQLVGMIEEGIDLARSLARGLAPVELDMQGLMAALRELAHRTGLGGRVMCELEMPEPVFLNEPRVITQLFRIAQEAVRNAVRHSGAERIVIGLHQAGEKLVMNVTDDGVGLPEVWPTEGMGLNIMKHRAEMIGAEILIERASKGTKVEVSVAAGG